MPLIEWLDRIDKYLFLLIHYDSDRFFFDPIMVLIRNPYTWMPLYMFLVAYVILQHKAKAGQFIFLSILTFSFTDSITARILKPMFGRLRPCHDPELNGFVRGLIDCGGSWSMPSNHAANHFGLAVFWFWSLWLMSGKKWHLLWAWAAVICYAQVYVGKHYPFDVLVGGVFGWAVGITSAKIFHRWAYPAKKVLIVPKPSEHSFEPSLSENLL